MARRDEEVALGRAHYGRDRDNQLPAHRHNKRTDGCTCQPWVYNPRYPAPINPECPRHGGDTDQ